MRFQPLLVSKGVARWVGEQCKFIKEEKEQKAVLFLAMIIQKSQQDLSDLSCTCVLLRLESVRSCRGLNENVLGRILARLLPSSYLL